MGFFFRKKSPAPPIDWIIAGLGNPGSKYQSTRHNVGFMVLDRLADRLSARLSRLRFRALVEDVRSPYGRLLLMKPQTYMNLSGDSISEALAFYKLDPERLIVVFDDMSLPFGKIRVRDKGSSGGHNGIKSIINELGSDAFPRVKVGIGTPVFHDTKDYVLSRFEENERTRMPLIFDAAADAVLELVQNGPESAARKFNGFFAE